MAGVGLLISDSGRHPSIEFCLTPCIDLGYLCPYYSQNFTMPDDLSGRISTVYPLTHAHHWGRRCSRRDSVTALSGGLDCAYAWHLAGPSAV